MRSGIVTIILSLCFLTACSVQPYKQTLPRNELPSLKKTRVISHIDQEQLYAQFDTQYTHISGGFMLGTVGVLASSLVAMLVDYNITKQNEEEARHGVKPILAAIRNYNIEALLHSALNKNKRGLKQLSVSNYEAFRSSESELGDELLNQIIHNSPEESVLVLTSNYSLTPDFRALNITTIARLYHKDHYEQVNSIKYHKPLYVNKFIYQSDKFDAPGLSEAEAYEKIDVIEKQYQRAMRSNPQQARALEVEKLQKQAAIWRLTQLTSLQEKELAAMTWAADNGKILKKTIATGAQHIVNMVNLDMAVINPTRPEDFGYHDEVVYESNDRVIKRKMTGSEIGILVSTGKNEAVNIGGIVFTSMLLP